MTTTQLAHLRLVHRNEDLLTYKQQDGLLAYVETLEIDKMRLDFLGSPADHEDVVDAINAGDSDIRAVIDHEMKQQTQP